MPLQADEGMEFKSGKTWTHNSGFSCTFRQWGAKSHCRFLHGYALQVEITFGSAHLNETNWVMDFGALKPVKEWIANNFDHKTLIARDDPHRDLLKEMHRKEVADIVYVDYVGCEAFAKMIYDHTMWWLTQEKIPWVYVDKVVVREHESNWGGYGRK